MRIRTRLSGDVGRLITLAFVSDQGALFHNPALEESPKIRELIGSTNTTAVEFRLTCHSS
jgi:hypothetical protein